jgi:hypothetical protein
MIQQLAEQLTFIYQHVETWHKKKLSNAEANLYHERLLMQGNIVTIVEDGVLKGYIEIWRINYEQLGRLMCGETIFAFDENITDGNIAYVNNGWIAEDYRNIDMARKLEKKFMEKFKDCKYISRKRQKYSESFKVYPMVK